METQRRAAVALLAFVAVAGALVFGVYAVGGQPASAGIDPVADGRQERVRDRPGGLASVSGPGVDLIADDRARPSSC